MIILLDISPRSSCLVHESDNFKFSCRIDHYPEGISRAFGSGHTITDELMWVEFLTVI
jgi:hypothetical protein